MGKKLRMGARGKKVPGRRERLSRLDVMGWQNLRWIEKLHIVTFLFPYQLMF